MIRVDVQHGLELGEFHYTVDCSEQAEKDLRADLNFGEHSQSQRRLRITKEHGDEQYHSTFSHELIEAINEVYCLRKLNHDHITNLAHGLAQALKSLGIQFTYGE